MLNIARHTIRPTLYAPLTVRLVHDPSASFGPKLPHSTCATAPARPKDNLAGASSLSGSFDRRPLAAKTGGKAKKPEVKKKGEQLSSHRATQPVAKPSARAATQTINLSPRGSTQLTEIKDLEKRTEPDDHVAKAVPETSLKSSDSSGSSANVKYASAQAPWQVLREAFAQEMAEQASVLRARSDSQANLSVPPRRPMVKPPYMKADTRNRQRSKGATSPAAGVQDRRPAVQKTRPPTTLRPPSRVSKESQPATAPPVTKEPSIETRAFEAIVNGVSPTSNAHSGKTTEKLRYPLDSANKKSPAVSRGKKVSRPPTRDGKPLRRTTPRLRMQRDIEADILEANLEAYSYSTPVGGWSIPCPHISGRLLPPAFYSAPTAKPALAVTSHVEEADDLLQCIPLGTPLGLDAEWKVNFGSGVISKTALLQICSPTLIVIIQCRRMKNLPRRLVELLQDPGTIKTGVAVVADCRRLQRDFKVTAQGILELGSLAKSVDAERWSSNNGLIGLSTLCRIYLDRRLVKGPVRTSDWEGPLSKQQIDYAASDAFVALEILGKLCSLTSQSGAEQTGIRRVSSRSHKAHHCEDDMAISAFVGPEHTRPSAAAGKKKEKSTAGSGQSKDDAIDLADSSGDEGSNIAEEIFHEKTKKSDWFVRPHYSRPQKSGKSSPKHNGIYSHLVHLSAPTPGADTRAADVRASK